MEGGTKMGVVKKDIFYILQQNINMTLTLKTLSEEIGKIRKIPQLVYKSAIDPFGMVRLRHEIRKYTNKKYPNNEVDFIIHSPGGSPDDAYRMIRALRTNFEIVNVIVPFWAKSAATLLSLGATKIIMDEYGEFGPLDMQLGKTKDDGTGVEMESALNDELSIERIEERFKDMYESMYLRIYNNPGISINKNDVSQQVIDSLTKLYSSILGQINPYLLGDKKRKLDIATHYAKRILVQFNKDNVTQSESAELVEFLVNGCPDHGYILDYTLMQQLLPKIVFKTSDISLEYKKAIGELSMFLMLDQKPSERSISFLYNPHEQVVDKEIVKKIVKEQKITNLAPQKTPQNGKKPNQKAKPVSRSN
jgi:hypothetical protein